MNELKFLNNIPHTHFIILRGSSGTSYSHGPDMREIQEAILEENYHKASKVLRETYKLIFYLANMKTPVISILNGHMVTGGSGLGSYANYSVVTNSTMYSCPSPCKNKNKK
jgi:enoyl-CoA hydratase/carnithine racemase